MVIQAAFAAKRNLKMDKRAWTISWVELISIFLFVVFFVTLFYSDAFANLKKIVFKEQDAEAKQQLEELVKYISADIDNLKDINRKPDGQTYPISLDGAKYALSAKNCEIDSIGKCLKDKPKTQLCLRIINVKDYCSQKKLDFAFDNEIYQVASGNLRIAWANNKLSLSFI